jgi:hypothetical protein
VFQTVRTKLLGSDHFADTEEVATAGGEASSGSPNSQANTEAEAQVPQPPGPAQNAETQVTTRPKAKSDPEPASTLGRVSEGRRLSRTEPELRIDQTPVPRTLTFIPARLRLLPDFAPDISQTWSSSCYSVLDNAAERVGRNFTTTHALGSVAARLKGNATRLSKRGDLKEAIGS